MNPSEVGRDKKLLRAIFIAILILLGFTSLYLLWELLPILILATLLAYTIEVISKPLNTFLARRGIKIPRERQFLITYLVVIIALVILALLILPPLARDVSNLINEFPSYAKKFSRTFNLILMKFKIASPSLKDLNLYELTQELLRAISGVLGNLYSSIRGILSSALSLIALIVIVPIFSFYISYSKDGIYKGILEVFPRSSREEVKYVLQVFDKSLREYIKGLILNISAISLMTIIALFPIFKASSFGLGIIYGISSIIPLIGPIFGASLGVIIGFSKGLWIGVGTLVIYVLIQQICDNIITPRILGETLKMSPLLVILSMAIFFKVFGLVGPLIAVPVTYTLGKSLSRWASKL